MMPQWLRLAIYVAAAVACVWLILRWWQARRLARLDQPTSRPQQASSTSTATARTDVPAAAMTSSSPAEPEPPKPDISDNVLFAEPTPTPSTPPAGLTILKSGVTLDVPQSDSQAATQIIVSTSDHGKTANDWRPSPWADRTLLTKAQAESNALPHLRAEDVPLTREDDYVFGPVTPTLAAFLPEAPQRFEESRKELQAAGYYQPHALQNFAAIRYVFIMLGLVIAGVALIMVPPQVEWVAIASLIALPLLGWAIPRLYIRGQAAERRSEIERGMPDLLDMLNMCVSQGLTIPDSLRRILPDLRGPYPALAQELRIVTQQASIWNMQTALENFGKRIDIPEVHSFSSLLTQTERMGTSISEALSSYSDTMRESLRQRADEKGNRATFRLLFPTVLCLMPAVYLFLLGPAIVELSNFFSSGGRDALDQGSAVIQRLNEQRGLPGPFDTGN